MSINLPEAKKFKKSITKLYIIRTLCVRVGYRLRLVLKEVDPFVMIGPGDGHAVALRMSLTKSYLLSNIHLEWPNGSLHRGW